MKYTFEKAEKSTVKITIDLNEKEWQEAINAAYEKTKGRIPDAELKKIDISAYEEESN